MQLGAADRTHLLEKLIACLDADPAVEAAWEQVADRREATLNSGATAEVSSADALARLRAKLPQ